MKLLIIPTLICAISFESFAGVAASAAQAVRSAAKRLEIKDVNTIKISVEKPILRSIVKGPDGRIVDVEMDLPKSDIKPFTSESLYYDKTDDSMSVVRKYQLQNGTLTNIENYSLLTIDGKIYRENVRLVSEFGGKKIELIKANQKVHVNLYGKNKEINTIEINTSELGEVLGFRITSIANDQVHVAIQTLKNGGMQEYSYVVKNGIEPKMNLPIKELSLKQQLEQGFVAREKSSPAISPYSKRSKKTIPSAQDVQ